MSLGRSVVRGVTASLALLLAVNPARAQEPKPPEVLVMATGGTIASTGNYYGDRGYIDFQVTHDSLEVDPNTGKAALHLTVDEGEFYRVGKFDIVGNRRFSTDELLLLYPFKADTLRADAGPKAFNREAWDKATREKARKK